MNNKLNEALTRLSARGVEFTEQDPYSGRYSGLKKNILSEKNRPIIRIAIGNFNIKGKKVDIGLHYDIELDSFIVRSDTYKVYTTADGTKVRISSTSFHATTSPKNGQPRFYKVFKDGKLLAKDDWYNKDLLVPDELNQLGTFDRPDYLEIIRQYANLCDYKITANDINDVRKTTEEYPVQHYNSDQKAAVAKQINDFIQNKRESKAPQVKEDEVNNGTVGNSSSEDDVAM